MGICYMAQKTQTVALYQPRRVGWGGKQKKFQKGVDICIPIADWCWGLTENNKILQSNSVQFSSVAQSCPALCNDPSIKNKF